MEKIIIATLGIFLGIAINQICRQRMKPQYLLGTHQSLLIELSKTATLIQVLHTCKLVPIKEKQKQANDAVMLLMIFINENKGDFSDTLIIKCNKLLEVDYCDSIDPQRWHIHFESQLNALKAEIVSDPESFESKSNRMNLNYSSINTEQIEGFNFMNKDK